MINLGVLNGCLCLAVDSRFDINVWVMKDYAIKESWTREFDIRVEFLVFSPTQILRVLLCQERLLAYFPERRGFVKFEVDGISCCIGSVYVQTPTVVSLKDVIRVQNLEYQITPRPFKRRPGKPNKLRTKGTAELEPPPQNKTKTKRCRICEGQSRECAIYSCTS